MPTLTMTTMQMPTTTIMDKRVTGNGTPASCAKNEINRQTGMKAISYKH